MGSHLLSKSSFLKGIQCEKQLYLYKHHYDLMDPVSEEQQAIFDRGTNVGLLARQLFPGGAKATEDPRDSDLAVARTSELLTKSNGVIYEAAFLFDGVLVISDIIVKTGDKWKIYEVKSSTSVSETYIYDAAIQYYVLKSSGLDISDVSIVYLNNQFVRMGELNIQELFTVESVLGQVKEQWDFVTQKVAALKKVVRKRSIPDIKIGPQCHNPYDCSFLGTCWKEVPEYSIFDIAGMRTEKKFDLFNRGVINIEDIPKDFLLSGNQRIQVDNQINNSTVIDKKSIKQFLESLSYPLYFIDFETFMPAVPLYDNSRPYQQIAFQYSMHYQRSKESELKHAEFLADGKRDPRIPFIENLLRDTEGKGDIIVYNQAFEMSRLKEIAEDFPEYKRGINELLKRIKDLMLPFQKKYYYNPEMKGSYSIKNVLPALVPEMSYDGMAIAEGGAAMNAFEALIYETDREVIEKTRKDLLEYCKMDTLGMVEIINKLSALISN
jgi:Domain of unknown function(DUF2779)